MGRVRNAQKTAQVRFAETMVAVGHVGPAPTPIFVWKGAANAKVHVKTPPVVTMGVVVHADNVKQAMFA